MESGPLLPVTDVTRMLGRIRDGDREALGELLPLVYDELQRIAGARMAALPPGQTLQATALVHEAYMKLVGDPQARFENRAHFFGAAARAMRNVLVDEYRAKSRVKRGGDRDRVPLDVSLPDPGADVDLLALHEALERLEQQDAEKAEIVMLRYFAGLTVPEVAETTGLSVATVERRWSFAKAWLLREVRKGDS